MGLLFLLKLIPQLKDLDLNLAFAIVLEDSLVGLPLLVPQAVEVFGVGSAVFARLDVGEVALDVSRSATAARRGKADVVRHGRIQRRYCNFGNLSRS